MDQVIDQYCLSTTTKFTPAPCKHLVSSLECPPAGPEGDEERNFMQGKPFREAVGDLLWISRLYRNDIAHAVAALSRIAHNPGKSHWIALQHLLQYLRHTRHFKLVYKKTHKSMDDYVPTVESYSDSDWAPNYGTKYNNYRSTTGNVTLVDGNPIHWRSRRQQRAALSSNEAEYYAAAEAVKIVFISAAFLNHWLQTKQRSKCPY